jgi:hypothetical protein
LPVSAIDDVFDGGERIRITNLVNGARFRVARGGSTSGPYRTWGAAHLVTMTPAVSAGETIEVVQTMCPSNPSSEPGSTVVLPCSELPAPTVHPIEVGAPLALSVRCGTAQAHWDGTWVKMLRQLGFSGVRRVASYSTILGRVALVRARRPLLSSP